MEITYKFGEVKFDFTIAIDEEDIVEYLTPTCMGLNVEEKTYFKFGIRKVVEQEWLDYDKLEQDKYFYDFMKKKYESEAKCYYKDNYENE